MTVRLPSWLYVRVDRDLRAALANEAATIGTSVSELARRELRSALARRLSPADRDPPPPPPAAPAAALRPAA